MRESLLSFCNNNNLPYQRIWYRINVKGMSLEDAIKDNPLCKHKYKDITFRQYCLKHNLPYSALIGKMTRKKISIEEIVNERLQRAIP